MNTSEITVALLAGGMGTRLQSVVSDRPKVLADIGGSPFLERILEQLAEAGFRHVVLCTGYLAPQIEAAFGSSAAGLKLEYSVELAPLGTAGAIANALSKLRSEAALVMNGDSFCDADLGAFVRAQSEPAQNASILLVDIEDASRYGKVMLESSGRVATFIEKGQSGPGTINAGIYLIAKSLLQQIPHGVSCSMEREMFPRWVVQGKLYGWKAEATRFIDIGTPESYETAKQLFGGKE